MKQFKSISQAEIDYIRIPSAEIASSQEGLIQLDIANKKAIDLIRGKGNDMGYLYEKKEDIIKLFEHTKLYNTQESKINS